MRPAAAPRVLLGHIQPLKWRLRVGKSGLGSCHVTDRLQGGPHDPHCLVFTLLCDDPLPWSEGGTFNWLPTNRIWQG